jgi:alkylation response protein AidB-like acyl-CoA dehydrogenase
MAADAVSGWTEHIDGLGPAFAERAGRHDDDDTFVAQNYEDLKGARFFSAMVPEELGGGGVSHREMCGLIRQLASYCSFTGLATSMHQHLIAAAVYNHLHGNPGRALLEKVAREQIVLVSTGGNDWLESGGVMERVDGGYRVRAFKPFASGTPAGAIAMTSSVYENPEEGAQVLHFPVPLDADGVRVEENWIAHGMRGTGSHTIVFEGVFVPEESIALARPAGAFHPVWNLVTTVALPLIAAAYVGVADAAAAIARDKAKSRPTDPVVPVVLGEMENQLRIAELALDDMVARANDWDFEPIIENGNAALIGKTIAVRAAEMAVAKAIEATGGSSYFRSNTLERLMRDVRAGDFHPLPEKRQQFFTGRIAMGLDPVSGAQAG